MINPVNALRRNVVSGYISQIYISIIGIILLPLYMKYMGKEAFGLVGFFSMLQAWFGLLDMGLTPTVARVSARFKGGALPLTEYRRLLRALEGVFLMLALAGSLILFFSAGWIASKWLKVGQLPAAEVITAIQFMGISTGLRWMCGFYRGVISGSEHLVLLARFNSTIATLRFVGVLPVLMFVSATPIAFFGFQFAVAIIELTAIISLVYWILPAIPKGHSIRWEWAPLKPVLKFSMTIAFTSSVWVLVTQVDKLVLSKLLPLAEYGAFTLAVLVANSITMLTSPVSAAIMPRMARLDAEGDHEGVIRLYRQSTQLVAVLAGSAAVTIAFFAETLLWAWTGDHAVALHAAPVLELYALGNGVLSVSAFPYYLQFAKGDLRLHLVGNAIFVTLLIPSTIWAAAHFGGIGAGYVWLITNLATFILWLPFVHGKFEPGLNSKWYLWDILPIFATVVFAGYAASQAKSDIENRALQFALVAMAGALVLLAGMAASSVIREKAIGLLKSVFPCKAGTSSP